MKKVLFIIPTLTQTNGVAAFIVNYLSRFKLNNFEVEVIYNNLRPAQKYIDFFKSKGIRTYALPYVRDVGLKNYKEKIKKYINKYYEDPITLFQDAVDSFNRNKLFQDLPDMQVHQIEKFEADPSEAYNAYESFFEERKEFITRHNKK